VTRRLVVIAVAAVATFSAGVGVLAANGTHHVTADRPINQQASAWTTARTAGTGAWQTINWNAVEGAHVQVQPPPITVHAAGIVTVTVSAAFSGGPVEIRVTEFGQTIRPGIVRFSSQAGSHAFSFTFLHGAPGEACGREFAVEWRLATSAPAWLNRADAVATYQKDTHNYGSVGCA
jgi:hypothetical protein